MDDMGISMAPWTFEMLLIHSSSRIFPTALSLSNNIVTGSSSTIFLDFLLLSYHIKVQA